MKKNLMKIGALSLLVLLGACEKVSVQNPQSNVLSSNPDEIFVQEDKSTKWITLTEYNTKFAGEKAQLYARRMCLVDVNGVETIGETCARADFSNCPSQTPCIVR